MEKTRLVEHRGKWAIRIKRRRYSTGFDATPENREAAKRKASEIAQAMKFTPIGGTCEDIMQAYLADRYDAVNCVEPDNLMYNWKMAAPHFGNLSPEEITRQVCRAYHVLREDSKPATINKHLATLRAGLNWHYGKNAMPAMFELLPLDEPRDRWITKGEFHRLLEGANAEHLRLFYHLAIATAGRKSAILEMKWQSEKEPNVRWIENTIFLGRKPNGKKRATVPMTNRVRSELEAAYKNRTCDHVIEYAGNGVKDVKRAHAAACRNAGIKDFTIHDLRHTAAVWMCGNGTPMEKISTYLGHTNVDITARVYARYQPDHLKDAASALEV